MLLNVVLSPGYCMGHSRGYGRLPSLIWASQDCHEMEVVIMTLLMHEDLTGALAVQHMCRHRVIIQWNLARC